MVRIVCWCVAALCAVAAAGASRKAAFRAAVVKTDITPSEPKWLLGYGARQSAGVHSRLYHRTLALDDGRVQFFLVSSDLCLVSPVLYDAFTAELEKETGILPVHVWWTFTHTHSAPEVGPPGLPAAMMPERYRHPIDEAYTNRIKKVFLEGIREARAKLAPARLRAGTGTAQANVNRRARDAKGRIVLGINPEGPVDRQIGLLRIERPGGAPVALVASYAMHGTTLGGSNRLISSDSPGVAAEYVERKLGAPLLFVNAAAGDVAPIHTVKKDVESAHLEEFERLLGDAILAADRALPARPQKVILKAAAATVRTPRNPDCGWTDELRDYLVASSSGPGLVRLPVRFLQISDEVAVWSAPVELFNEIAVDVRRVSPFRTTFYYGYTNGWLGYLPTRKAFSEGGYEIRTSPYTAQVEDDLKHAVVANLKALRR